MHESKLYLKSVCACVRCARESSCVSVSVRVRVRVHVCARVCVCAHACACVCICVCVCICAPEADQRAVDGDGVRASSGECVAVSEQIYKCKRVV